MSRFLPLFLDCRNGPSRFLSDYYYVYYLLTLGPTRRVLASMCATSAAAAVRRKYGKYLPHQRANVDQVPLPFVNDMESTYE